MRDEGRGKRDERRRTRAERRGRKASVVPASKASGHPSPILMALLTLLILLSSCGYRLSGTGGIVPQGYRTIAVLVFVNGTNEPYVDVEVTKAVVNEFLTDGRLKITDPEEADLALRGKVTKYEAIALSYTPDAYVQQYRVRLVVDALLEDLRSKKTLWQERGIESSFISDHPVTIGDIRATKIAKESAIKKAAQDIAWTVRSRVLEGF